MTKVGEWALRTMTVLVLVEVSSGQAMRAAEGARAVVPVDTEVKISFDGRSISVEPRLAFVSSKSPFRWVVGSVRGGASLEIDFRVQGTRKGPFERPKGGFTGRYTAKPGETVPAGGVAQGGREAWKYDLIVRDEGGKDLAATDPMIIIIE